MACGGGVACGGVLVHHWTRAPQVKKSAELAASVATAGQPHAADFAGSTCVKTDAGSRGVRQRSRTQNEGM